MINNDNVMELAWKTGFDKGYKLGFAASIKRGLAQGLERAKLVPDVDDNDDRDPGEDDYDRAGLLKLAKDCEKHLRRRKWFSDYEQSFITSRVGMLEEGEPLSPKQRDRLRKLNTRMRRLLRGER